MFIAVFQGQKPTGGYEVRIEKITSADGRLNVYIRNVEPTPSDMVVQVLTSPYHIVKVRVADKPADFKNWQN